MVRTSPVGTDFRSLMLNAYSRAVLEQIGRQLDQSIFPEVHNGGPVLPGPTAVDSIMPGKELVRFDCAYIYYM